MVNRRRKAYWIKFRITEVVIRIIGKVNRTELCFLIQYIKAARSELFERKFFMFSFILMFVLKCAVVFCNKFQKGQTISILFLTGMVIGKMSEEIAQQFKLADIRFGNHRRKTN